MGWIVAEKRNAADAANETMVQCEGLYLTIMYKNIVVCWSAHVAWLQTAGCATARGGIFLLRESQRSKMAARGPLNICSMRKGCDGEEKRKEW